MVRVQLMQWKMLHPKMSIEYLGLIPCWFMEGDLRPAREIIEDNYSHGGGFSHIAGFKMNEDNSLKYPGDPVLKPLASAQHGAELILFYDCAILAVVQPDKSFEVTRVD